MAGLPQFLISTQTDPYWEIPLFDSAGNPLSVEGRTFEAWIAPATTKTGVAEPVEEIKVLTFQDGLSLVPPTDGSGDQTKKNTFVHQVSRAFAQANFPRGELTADILEVVDGARRMFAPVRLFYGDPAQIRDFVADRAGITFGQGRQPIVTPVAIAGQAGRRGSGLLTGTLPPQPSDGEDGDYWVVEREAQANLVYGPKENGEWPPEPSSTFGVGGIADIPDAGEAAKLGVSTVEQAQEAQSDAVALTPAKGKTLLDAQLASTTVTSAGSTAALADWLARFPQYGTQVAQKQNVFYGQQQVRTAGAEPSLVVMTNPNGITFTTVGNKYWNQIFMADDSSVQDTPTHNQHSVLSVEMRKNMSNNPAQNGGMNGTYFRAVLGNPTADTNSNRNYTGFQCDLQTNYGDGGFQTVIAVGGAAGDTAVTLGAISASVANGRTSTLQASDTLVIVSAATGKWQRIFPSAKPTTNTVSLASPLAADVAAGDVVYVPRGGFFGNSTLARATPNAKMLLNITCSEDNTWVEAGATTLCKSVRSFIGAPADAVQGTLIDSMISFSNQGGAVKWRTLIEASDYNGSWPLAPDGSVFAVDKGRANSSFSAAYGIDLRGINFSQYAFASTGFFISNQGHVYCGRTNAALGNAGVVLLATGVIRADAPNAPAQQLNRLGSDGAVALFYRDSSSKGSINVYTNGVELATATTNDNLALTASGTGRVIFNAPGRLKSYTVATLPSAGVAAGDIAFASNARCLGLNGVQEAAGAGTGSVVEYKSGGWKIIGHNVPAAA